MGTYVIWKYDIEIKGEVQEFNLPVGSRLLSVQMQRDKPRLWVAVDQDSVINEKRRLLVVGTGHPFSNECEYNHIGTFQLFDGDLVLHLVEVL